MGNFPANGSSSPFGEDQEHFYEMSYEQICGYWETGGGLFFSADLKGAWYTQNLTALSYLGNLIVGGIIYLNKDLIYIHPMKLFMMIALTDSFMFWMLFMEPFICKLGLPELFLITTGSQVDENHLTVLSRSLAFFCESLKVFCYVTTLNLNICVCIDMVLMIKNPFTKQTSRMKYYQILSIFGGLVAIIVELLSVHKEFVNQAIELWCYSIFLITGFGSIITSCRMLSRPGVSIEVRKLIISRHISYFLLYATSNLFIAIRNIYFVFGLDATSFNDQWYVLLLSIMFYCQGIFVATLRWYEPAFYQIAWRQFKKKIESRQKKNPKSAFARTFSVFKRKSNTEEQ